ncbi:exo-1,3-beta-glucanase [Mortierella sp. AD094]|nr:exo-1,3-beta-glucanase [Mortierella sp. AD094]
MFLKSLGSALFTIAASTLIVMKSLADPIRGVTLGGLFNTWVTEEEIKKLSQLGLNSLRIPIGYWAFLARDSDPYVQGQIPYFKQNLGWANLYNMRVHLVLQGIPGSQNGFDSSGQTTKTPQWPDSPLNIEQSLSALQSLALLANEYSCVNAIETVEKPAGFYSEYMLSTLKKYNTQAHDVVFRTAPQVLLVISDAFQPFSWWAYQDLNLNLTNVYLDRHTYRIFSVPENQLSHQQHLQAICDVGEDIKSFNKTIPVITGGFSLAANDCAKYRNGRGVGSRYDGTYPGSTRVGSCTGISYDISTWSDTYKTFLTEFAQKQINSYEKGSGWFFNNFKTESSDDWNFIKLAENGIIPFPLDKLTYQC